jgi:hypothetical protein
VLLLGLVLTEQQIRGGDSQMPLAPLASVLLLGTGFWFVSRGRTATPSLPCPHPGLRWLGGLGLGAGLLVGGIDAGLLYRLGNAADWDPAPGSPQVCLALGLIASGGILVGFWALTAAWPRSTLPPGTPGSGRIVTLTLITLGVAALSFLPAPNASVAAAWKQFSDRRTTPVISLLHWEPLRVEGRTVFIRLNSIGSVAPAEFRVFLEGPPLNRNETQDFPTSSLSMARSGAPAGNQPWLVVPVGNITWELGLVFPSATHAREVFQQVHGRQWISPALQPIDLFDVTTPDGSQFRTTLDLRAFRALTQPETVLVNAQSTRNEQSLRLVWEVTAPREGWAEIVDGEEVTQVRLQPESGALPYVTRIEMSASPLPAGGTRVVTVVGDSSSIQNRRTPFAELSALWGSSATYSAKARRGEAVELAWRREPRFQIRVLDGIGEGSPQMPRPLRAAPGAAIP